MSQFLRQIRSLHTFITQSHFLLCNLNNKYVYLTQLFNICSKNSFHWAYYFISVSLTRNKIRVRTTTKSVKKKFKNSFRTFCLAFIYKQTNLSSFEFANWFCNFMFWMERNKELRSPSSTMFINS